jgi:hypothetical protein
LRKVQVLQSGETGSIMGNPAGRPPIFFNELLPETLRQPLRDEACQEADRRARRVGGNDAHRSDRVFEGAGAGGSNRRPISATAGPQVNVRCAVMLLPTGRLRLRGGVVPFGRQRHPWLPASAVANGHTGETTSKRKA